MKNVVASVASDLKVVFRSIFLSIVAFLLISFWRLFSPDMFLLTQILLVSGALYLSMLLPWLKKFFRNEAERLSTILVVFLLLTSILLNIDRSRSVYVIKWTSEASFSKSVSAEDILQYKRLPSSELSPVNQRLVEQSQIGTLRRSGEKFSLSITGKIVLKFASVVASLASLDGFRRA